MLPIGYFSFSFLKSHVLNSFVRPYTKGGRGEGGEREKRRRKKEKQQMKVPWIICSRRRSVLVKRKKNHEPQTIIVNFKEWLRDAIYLNWNKSFALESRPQVGADLQISCQTSACWRQQHFRLAYPRGQFWQFLCAVMWTAHVIMVIACRNWMQTAQLICVGFFFKGSNLATLYTKESNNNYNVLFKPLWTSSVFPCSCAKIFSSCQCACTLIGRYFLSLNHQERWMNFSCLTECLYSIS